MIDFVKISYQCPDNRFILNLINNPLLDFECVVSEKTGEIKSNFLQAGYKNLKFFLYNKEKLYIQGSLHKYFNDGVHNYNDFTFSNLKDILQDLTDKFHLIPELCILQNLETGLNIKLPFKPLLILDNLLQYKGKEFIKPLHADYYQCVRDRYLIKIYDKGTQYRVKENILRFEIKYIKMYELNNAGIFNMQDLLDFKNWELFTLLLLERWQQVLFYDTSVRGKELTKIQQKNLHKYSNPYFWRNLTNRKKRFFHLTSYKKVIKKYSDNRHKIIRDLIIKKWDVFTGKFEDETKRKHTKNKNQKIGRFHTSYIGLHCPVLNIHNQDKEKSKRKTKKCPVTGVDISMQKGKSFLLSHTGLRYYLHADKKLFDEVKSKYLPEKWKGSDIKTQIKELAHNIRNIQNNQKLQQQKLYKKDQLNFTYLFS